jgi:hypothetical protein
MKSVSPDSDPSRAASSLSFSESSSHTVQVDDLTVLPIN